MQTRQIHWTSDSQWTANGNWDDFQDAALGVHLAAITVDARMDGDTVRLERLQGKAGSGTVSGGGTVRLGDTQLPGNQHRIESGLQPQRSELRALVIDGCVGDRGQPQTEGPQRPQVRQYVVKGPPGLDLRRAVRLY